MSKAASVVVHETDLENCSFSEVRLNGSKHGTRHTDVLLVSAVKFKINILINA